MLGNLDSFIENLLADFNPKQRRVVVWRFGLVDGERKTLQEIGDELGITRERVRQIESHALKILAKKIKDRAASFIGSVNDYLRNIGGVRRDDCFVEDIRHVFFAGDETKQISSKIRFLFFVAGEPFYEKESDDYHAFWYADKKSKNELEKFVKKSLAFFNKHGREKILKDKSHLNLCSDFRNCHFLSVSKKFAVSVFGDVGLHDWPEINPKTVRDRSYLILKKVEKPLHFGEIAAGIDRHEISGKKRTHVQTVHNELIKDDRFVLVGRGIYALREHGFEPGTVREVITRILKKNGPLSPPEVIKLVEKERLLKKNTILLTLQNRRYFKRMADGRYVLKSGKTSEVLPGKENAQ